MSVTTAFIGNWLSGVFGESMHRYRYDLDSGTSYYRNTDGTVDSWQSPQRRGTKQLNCIEEKIISITLDGNLLNEKNLMDNFEALKMGKR